MNGIRFMVESQLKEGTLVVQGGDDLQTSLRASDKGEGTLYIKKTDWPSLTTGKILKGANGYLRQHPYLDIVIVTKGEGELFRNMAEYLTANYDPQLPRHGGVRVQTTLFAEEFFPESRKLPPRECADKPRKKAPSASVKLESWSSLKSRLMAEESVWMDETEAPDAPVEKHIPRKAPHERHSSRKASPDSYSSLGDFREMCESRSVVERFSSVALFEQCELPQEFIPLDEDFATTLRKLMDEKWKKKENELYDEIGLSKTGFWKIMTGKTNPSRLVVYALAIALHLDLDETKDLMSKAGYAINRSKIQDVIISFFIENGDYDRYHIDDVLDRYDLPTLPGAVS